MKAFRSLLKNFSQCQRLKFIQLLYRNLSFNIVLKCIVLCKQWQVKVKVNILL